MQNYFYSLSSIYPEVISSEYSTTSTRAEHYGYYPGGNFEVPPENVIVIIDNQNIPPDYYGINTIYLYETNQYLEVYGINTINGVVEAGSGLTTYKSDSDNEYEYNYFNPTKRTTITKRTRNVNINVVPASFDIYKGVLTNYPGTYMSADNYVQDTSFVEQIDYGNGYTIDSFSNGSNIENSIYTVDINIPALVLPNVQELILKQYEISSNRNRQIHTINQDIISDTESVTSNETDFKKQTNTALVYIPSVGTSTSFIKRTEYNISYSNGVPITNQQSYKTYLLNYTSSLVTDDISHEIIDLNIRKTNLIKNVFYESPIETEMLDPDLEVVIELPEYINKTIKIEGNKHTVGINGTVSKTTFNGKVQSLKIKPADNYTIHGISYFPKK